MRVLFLTCHLPYPPVSGGRRREWELLKRLSGRFEIDLAAVSKTVAEDRANVNIFRELCSSVTILPAANPPPELSNGNVVPYQVARHRSPQASEWVRHMLVEVDLIHVEGFYLMQHVPVDPAAPVFLQEQNVEYALWRQRTASATTKDQRKISLLQYLKTLEAEMDAWQRASLCAAVTDEDRRLMLEAAPELDVRVVPDGADHLAPLLLGEMGPPDPSLDPLVVFIANFAYEPNVDAALYLCREIIPSVFSSVPRARLLLVGNAPPPEVLALASHPRIQVTGRVESVEPFLDAADVVVCPLRIGGGIKVKMLEALCRGKAIVTTSVGMQGLAPAASDAAVVADDPHVFARRVARLLKHPEERMVLEQAAIAFSASLPTWDEATERLVDCYREVVRTPFSAAEVAPGEDGTARG